MTTPALRAVTEGNEGYEQEHGEIGTVDPTPEMPMKHQWAGRDHRAKLLDKGMIHALGGGGGTGHCDISSCS